MAKLSDSGAFGSISVAGDKALSSVSEFRNVAVKPPTFTEAATLEVARWILGLFTVVYILCFAYAFMLFFVPGSTFTALFEVVKYLIQSILPLATLAVGFYLGDKTKRGQPSPPAS